MGRSIPTGGAGRPTTAAPRRVGGFLFGLLQLLLVLTVLGGLSYASWLLHTDGAVPLVERLTNRYLDFNGDGVAGAPDDAQLVRCG